MMVMVAWHLCVRASLLVDVCGEKSIFGVCVCVEDAAVVVRVQRGSTGVAFLCEVCGTLPGAGVTVGGSKLAQQRGTVMKRGGGS